MTLLMRPEPFSQEFDRLFGSLFGAGARPASGVQRWVPPMDLVEAGDHFVLKADLPGLGEEDVTLEVQDNVLTISGERKTEHERTEQGWFRLERSYGSFSRSITLPDGVNADAVEAKFDRGVLEVRIPKPQERKPRRIAIGSAGQNGNGKHTIEGTTS
jgi:HSP20 family protein